MRNLSKFSALALAMVVSGMPAVAADAPAKTAWKEGWDRKQVKVYAYACTDGLFTPALRDYNAAAKASGVPMPKPFPEQRFRDSAFPMCLCIAERLAETWTVAEMKKDETKSARPMVDEALNGGRCKPEGLLGDLLKKKNEKKP
jgi:hypothetical protein